MKLFLLLMFCEFNIFPINFNLLSSNFSNNFLEETKLFLKETKEISIENNKNNENIENENIENKNNLSVIVVKDDVIIGNRLASYGTLCQDTFVYGSPRKDVKVYYILPRGKVVRLMEQSHGNDRSWVMIESANWIQLSALCKGQ